MRKHTSVYRSAARPWAVAARLLIRIVVGHAAVVGCGGAKTESGTETGSTSSTPAEGGASATGAGDTAAAPAVASVELGAKVYAERCALCHGASGKGDGTAAAALNPKPRDHTDGTYMKARSDEELLTVIRNGKGTMPAWGAILNEAEIQSVLLFVRTLAK